MMGRMQAAGRMQQSGTSGPSANSAVGKARAAKLEAVTLELTKQYKLNMRYVDPRNYSGLLRHYVRVARSVRETVEREWFNNFIIGVIIVAGVLVGVQTYPALENNPDINMIDFVILCIFTVEVIMKIISQGAAPWRYFTGNEWKWNVFDFTIVVASMPFLPFGGSQVALLRLFRLMRVAKLVRKIPQLQMIVMGLVGGLKSIGYILLLLFLVFYLYAIAGIMAFRGNDPWHFKSIPVAFVTLFRAATLEDWTDILYIGYYGCKRYPGGIYHPEGTRGVDSMYYCESPAPAPFVTILYWVTFIVIAALVMLSLFIGAVTMSMAESMQQMREDMETAKRRKHLAEAKQRQRALERLQGDGSPSPGPSAAQSPSPQAEPPRPSMLRRINSSPGEAGKVLPESALRMRALLRAAIEGRDVSGLVKRKKEIVPNNPALLQYTILAKKCRALTEHEHFTNFVTGVILLAGVQVGLQTDEMIAKAGATVLWWLDMIILSIFTLEVALKIIAESLFPWRYFYSKWNVFDFVVVAGSYVPGSGSLLTMLRLLRLLRVLKLVRSLPQLQVIVTALLEGVSSIGFIAIIMLLLFYFCGVVAMILFRDNDPWHFGSLHVTMLTLFRCATLEDWADVMYVNMFGCDTYGYDDMPELCEDPKAQFVLSALFFVGFVVLAALVLLTLFIGVVTMSMEEATMNMEEEDRKSAQELVVVQKYELPEFVVDLYREAFTILDMDGDGTVSEGEIETGLRLAGKKFSHNTLSKLMEVIDENSDNEVDFSEFLTFICEMKKHFDHGDGRISPDEQELYAELRGKAGNDSNDSNDKAGEAGIGTQPVLFAPHARQEVEMVAQSPNCSTRSLASSSGASEDEEDDEGRQEAKAGATNGDGGASNSTRIVARRARAMSRIEEVIDEEASSVAPSPARRPSDISPTHAAAFAACSTDDSQPSTAAAVAAALQSSESAMMTTTPTTAQSSNGRPGNQVPPQSRPNESSAPPPLQKKQSSCEAWTDSDVSTASGAAVAHPDSQDPDAVKLLGSPHQIQPSQQTQPEHRNNTQQEPFSDAQQHRQQQQGEERSPASEPSSDDRASPELNLMTTGSGTPRTQNNNAVQGSSRNQSRDGEDTSLNHPLSDAVTPFVADDSAIEMSGGTAAAGADVDSRGDGGGGGGSGGGGSDGNSNGVKDGFAGASNGSDGAVDDSDDTHTPVAVDAYAPMHSNSGSETSQP